MRSATVVLPVPGVAGEAHVQRRARRRPGPASRRSAIDHEQRRDLADARLDRLERDELAVELREHGLEVAGDAARRPRPCSRRRVRRCPVAVPACPVATPGGRVGRVGVQRVADLAIGLLLALEPEAGLDRRAGRR